MHLQQTKFGSRASGGPQYYFHDLSDTIKTHLRTKGVCPVVLQTPYGIAPSPFVAVGRDHKLGRDGSAQAGRVGHDRIQCTRSKDSIGEAIRLWYRLPANLDFERIDVDASIHADGHFILTPLSVRLRERSRLIPLERPTYPLSFSSQHQSKLWRDQMKHCAKTDPAAFAWAKGQLRTIVAQHQDKGEANVLETDLLRASGALDRFGVRLGPYRGVHYDCTPSEFQFLDLQPYSCPVEVKKKSSGFDYQILTYSPLPRVVVLCVEHDRMNLPEHVDVLELAELSQFLGKS